MNTAKQLFNIFALIVFCISVIAPLAYAETTVSNQEKNLWVTAFWENDKSNNLLTVKQGESPTLNLFVSTSADTYYVTVKLLDPTGINAPIVILEDPIAKTGAPFPSSGDINQPNQIIPLPINTANLNGGNYMVYTQVEIVGGEPVIINDISLNVIPTPVNPNNQPVIQPIPDQTVEKTKTVSFYVTATDQDNDPLNFGIKVLPVGALYEQVAKNQYEFSWTPDNNMVPGLYKVTFTVTDNKSPAVSTVANINIIEKTQPTPTNTPPTLSLPSQYPTTVKEGETLTIKLNAKDSDATANNIQPLTFTAQKYCSWTDFACILNLDNIFGSKYTYSIDANTGVFTFSPKYTFVTHPAVQDEITFKYFAYDGKDYSSPQYATFTVIDVNRAPVITSTPVTTATVNQPYTYTITTTDPDAEDISGVTSSLTNGPQGMTINNNLVTWTPTAVGKYHVTVVANDNVVSDPKDSASQSFTIVVSLDTDGDGIPDDKDNCPTTFNPDQKDSNNNGIGDACEAPVDTDGDGIPDSTDNCPLTPNPDQKDSDNNGIGDACENTPVNNWPIINPIGDKTVKVGETLRFDVQATDADNDPLTYSTQSDTLTNYDFSNQIFTFTPTANQVNKVYNMFFIVNDTKISTFEEITITVLPADNIPTNYKPVITSNPITSATVDELYTYPVKVTDDGPFTCSLTVAPQGMTISKDCVITWTPTHEGQEPVTIVVSDGEYTATQSYIITVSTYQGAKIMSLNLPEEPVTIGGYFQIGVNLENDGQKDLNDAKVSVIIYDLGIKASTSVFDFEKGTSRNKNLVVQIPSDVEPGEYLIKVILSNVYYHESAYRLVTVTQN